jgi:hypothetical protein
MPSWGEIAQILTAAAALCAFVQSWRNSVTITAVKHATNSMKDELVAEVRKSAHAEGVKDEADRTKTL